MKSAFIWHTKLNTVFLAAIKAALSSILLAVLIFRTRVSSSITNSIQTFPRSGTDIGFQTRNNSIYDEKKNSKSPNSVNNVKISCYQQKKQTNKQKQNH